MKTSPWVSYRNGNYTVKLNLDNGTKIRENDLDYLEASTVESMDIKITNACDRACSFCHENSTPDGKHADLFAPSFLDTLHPYTELAIGGGNPLEHPDLLKFLLRCKENKWIPSMTVNQYHFEKNFDFIMQLVNAKLIYGLGISLVEPTTPFVDKVKQIPNAVIHMIAGVHSIRKFEEIKDNNLKILILGYKQVRRGKQLYSKLSDVIEEQIGFLKKNLPEMIEDNWFDVISFDNLALNQLDVKNTLEIDDEEWKEFYMGDDGIGGKLSSASCFIDMVERKYAINSCSMERYDLKDTIEEMFMHLKNKEFYDDLRREQAEQM